MRELQCHFDEQPNNKIKCTWKEPEYSNGQVRYYHVRLINNGHYLYGNKTMGNIFELSYNFINAESYTVAVNAMTDQWSDTAATTLQYTPSGNFL